MMAVEINQRKRSKDIVEEECTHYGNDLIHWAKKRSKQTLHLIPQNRPSQAFSNFLF